MFLKGRIQVQLVSLILLTVFACSKPKRQVSNLLDTHADRHFTKYAQIHKLINDTLKNWVNDSLNVVKPFVFDSWEVDKVIAFNRDSNKIYTTVNRRNDGSKYSTQDDIEELFGIKQSNGWHFFLGATLVIPRENHQDSLYTPLSFQTLSKIAHDQFIDNAIVLHKDGSYSSNEKFFDDYFTDPLGCSTSLKQTFDWDSCVRATSAWYHSRKLEGKEIAKIKDEMARSVRPAEPVKSPYSNPWLVNIKSWIPSNNTIFILLTIFVIIVVVNRAFSKKNSD